MHISSDWKNVLKDEINEPYFKRIMAQVERAYEHEVVYPPKSQVFNAFQMTSFENTKVVLLGQDPYHGPKQAMGLSFSVPKGVKVPPSLKNIYKELKADIGYSIPKHGDLSSWAEEGVLLLNSVLTVKKGKAFSHHHLGWERFTDQVIKTISDKKMNVVFILWGKEALKKSELINPFKHFIIHGPHPSPLSARRGFFGSRPFSKTNEYLEDWNIEPINWNIT